MFSTAKAADKQTNKTRKSLLFYKTTLCFVENNAHDLFTYVL